MKGGIRTVTIEGDSSTYVPRLIVYRDSSKLLSVCISQFSIGTRKIVLLYFQNDVNTPQSEAGVKFKRYYRKWNTRVQEGHFLPHHFADMMYNSLRGGDLILKVVDTDSLSHVSIPDKVLAATYEKHPFDNEAMEFRIMSRNTVKAVSQQDIALLKQYKSICDDVLPGMRARSHLHNIIFRDKDTCTALLVDNNSSINPRIASVVGGSTFRLIRTGSRYTILEILTMVVAPRMKKRGRGLGTRITNALKFLTVQTTRLRRDYGSFILTQADNTTIAINFWKRQLLELNDSAAMVVAALNRIDPKKHHSYESAFPMLGILRASTSSIVQPRPSERAQKRIVYWY